MKCIDAYRQVFRASGDRIKAEAAYRATMPIMNSNATVRAFVAAVAQGVLLGVFNGAEASKLLYAAQVALAAIGKGKPCQKAD